MPVEINGVLYYRTKEACSLAGITKNTFLRWVSTGDYPDVSYRDRRQWRLFSEKDVRKLKAEANKIQLGRQRQTESELWT